MKWSTTEVHINEDVARTLARCFTRIYAIGHPEFMRVLTADERREQYADMYARTIMSFAA